MKVANIVSDTDLINLECFNVVKTIDEINPSLPTLIIGFDYTDKLFPGFDITEICVKGNIYWTFKKNEKRDKFQEDLNWFINKVCSDLIKDINYVFVDLLLYSPRKLIKIVKKIYSIKNIISYSIGNMIYIHGEKLIFGIDLNMLSYMDIDIIRVENKIKSICSVFLDNSEIFIEYKDNMERLNHSVKYIPYLYAIKNG